jgi:hypothetical protein
MSAYDDGRAWAALVPAGLAEATKAIIDCLRRYEKEDGALSGLAHVKAAIADIDKARTLAVYAQVHFEMAAEEERTKAPAPRGGHP